MECNIAAGIETRKAAPSDLAQRIIAQTSKGYHGPAILMLEDGTVFYGRACGASGTATGEVCFNTSLEGYFEVLTDPSYAGQIVTMTYPQVGNYGIDPADVQSAYPGGSDRGANTPALRGMVVHDMCAVPSNWRSTVSLPQYLKDNGVVAIENVDTRALVRHLRDNGAQKGIISTEVFSLPELADKLAEAGIEVVFDDRAERPGVKFADNDLMGFPFQLIVGKRGLANGTVELKVRATGERTDVERATAVDTVAQMVIAQRA